VLRPYERDGRSLGGHGRLAECDDCYSGSAGRDEHARYIPLAPDSWV